MEKFLENFFEGINEETSVENIWKSPFMRYLKEFLQTYLEVKISKEIDEFTEELIKKKVVEFLAFLDDSR